MGISVVLRKGSGERLLGLSDMADRVPPPTPPEVYDPVVSPDAWDRFPLLCGIDPYGVTVFNRRQSEKLRVELDQVEAETDDSSRRSLVRALKILIAEQCSGYHRQLWFLGD
jgi:hypothetical protein